MILLQNYEIWKGMSPLTRVHQLCDCLYGFGWNTCTAYNSKTLEHNSKIHALHCAVSVVLLAHQYTLS